MFYSYSQAKMIEKFFLFLLIAIFNISFLEAKDEDIEKQYLIESGDVLNILVTPAEELSKEVVVSQDGKIILPLIGDISVKGFTPYKLGQELENVFKKYITDPKVNVTVKTFASRRVYITGQISRSGDYAYQDGLKFFELVSKSGDFTDKANISQIKLYRGKGGERQIFTIDADKLKKEGKDILLQSGDTIDIPKITGDIFLLGEVNKQGVYEYKENQKLLELLTLAGGWTVNADISNVKIIRETQKGKETIEVDISKALSGEEIQTPVLKSGDYVYIPKTAISTWNWITTNIISTLSFISSLLTLYFIIK